MGTVRTRIAVLAGLTLAVGVAVYLSTQGTPPRSARTSGATTGNAPTPAPRIDPSPPRPVPSKSGWVPPEGDPVQRYRELRGTPPRARQDLIANFMALGHERNPYLLIEALDDADRDVRVHAVENAAALEIGEATAVLRAAAANADPDAREMAWSLAAPYPMESKVTIYGGAIETGNDAAFTEALGEMAVTPERPLFEMMLLQAARNEALSPARRARLLEEARLWLEPGGGDVPQFANPAEALQWWSAQQENYDEFLLRTDLGEDGP